MTDPGDPPLLGPSCPGYPALDRLEEPGADEARAHAATCLRCQAYLDWRRRAIAGFEGGIEDRIADRLQAAASAPAPPPDASSPSGRRRWLAVAGWGAAAAVALVGLGVALTPRGDLLRPKGGDGLDLEVAVLRAGDRFAWAGDPLQVGDRVRFRARVPAGWFALVHGVEASGARYALAPPGGRAVEADREGRVELPGATELDDSVGDESFILVACPRPFALVDVVTVPPAGCRCLTRPFVKRDDASRGP